jgi:hypothetical protein
MCFAPFSGRCAQVSWRDLERAANRAREAAATQGDASAHD